MTAKELETQIKETIADLKSGAIDKTKAQVLKDLIGKSIGVKRLQLGYAKLLVSLDQKAPSITGLLN